MGDPGTLVWVGISTLEGGEPKCGGDAWREAVEMRSPAEECRGKRDLPQ